MTCSHAVAAVTYRPASRISRQIYSLLLSRQNSGILFHKIRCKHSVGARQGGFVDLSPGGLGGSWLSPHFLHYALMHRSAAKELM